MVQGRRRSAVYDPEYRDLIKRVREAREEAGMTLREVANALDRPVSFVSKCELGERRMDPIDLRRFADILGKPIEYFYPPRQRRHRPEKKRAPK